MSFFDWLDAWLTKNFSCWFGSCRCPWKNAKMQEMWRCRRWVGEICGPCCRMVKLISSSRCSSISCCLFYGCWGAFCINHLAIARTKKTHYLTDLAQRWPICKIKLTSQLSVFTSWIGKCFPKFFGEKHEPRVSWLFKSLVDITADRCFLIIHIKTNGCVFRLHLITPFSGSNMVIQFSQQYIVQKKTHRNIGVLPWVFKTPLAPRCLLNNCTASAALFALLRAEQISWSLKHRGWCGLGNLPIKSLLSSRLNAD